MIMTKVTRFDTATINDTIITDEGYLKTTPIVTKVGIFNYIMPDGSIKRELRSAEEVLKNDSLETLKLVPVTNGHPPTKLINSKTAKKYTSGHLGEKITHDNKNVKATMLITDEDTIRDIQENGKKQISMGYIADVVDEPGMWNGQPYDSLQKNIIYNHAAIVMQGRAGKDVAIKLDEGDAIQTDEEFIINQSKKEDKVMSDSKMKSIILDGIEYNAAPEVINALTKADSKSKELLEVKNGLQSKVDELTAKNDSLSQENEELKTRDPEKEIVAAAKTRISLLSAVKDILNDEEFKTAQDLSEREIKETVLNKVIKNKISLDDKSMDYIDARFDAEVEKVGEAKFAKTRKLVHGDSITGDQKDKGAAAYQNMCDRLYNTEIKKAVN